MNEQIKKYLADHWVAMLLSTVSSGTVFIIALITMYINFTTDYKLMQKAVEANTLNNASILSIHEKILTDIATLTQEEMDDHILLEDLHRFTFGPH